MKNRELFVLDPIENKLLNNGVAEIGTDKLDANGQKIIMYELKTFVCEGEYEKGLSRILDTYIKYINDPMQPAVWVSGFFGSGKSHLVKMLGYLWEDFEFPSGETARKIKKLPESVNDKLFELNKYQNKFGRLAVSGTLKDFPSDDIRYSFFQFFLKGLGLPTQFHQFKFIYWLKQEGIYEDLENYIISQGKDFKKEYQNFLISPFISKGILKLKPEFAETEAQVREYLKANFERVNKISREDLLSTIKDEVLPLFYEKMPCILIVLDEVQQFISSDGNKTIEVQNLAQDLSNGFDGKLLFVATGQNALTETPFLQPLNDRFKVKVFLSDQDVETVTRKTVLEKKATAQATIKSLMEKSSGEVARNMQNTTFAYQSKDEVNLVADYPILPSTRKFWKKVLDVIDTAGTQGQLRSQLRIVDESVKEIAESEVGKIIPGDFIYQQKEQQLLQNARLLNDTYNLIVEKKAGNVDEQLQGRILSIAFLLDQLPSDLPGGTPKSNKDTIADLLIGDLSQSTDAFRIAVSKGIDALVDQKLLMPIGDEVKLQTKAGQEWEKEYTAQVQKLIAQGEDKIQDERNSRINNYFESIVKGIRLVHGAAKVPREINIHSGSQKPSTDNKINIWIRDGWMENEKLILEEIRREGTDAPLSYAYIIKNRDADLKNEITKYLAAKESLDLKGIPSDPEGQQARRSMETRAEKANEASTDLITRIADDTAIYLAGGTKIEEDSTRKSLEKIVKQMLDRQFPEFGKADHANWATALRAALNKNPNPLEKIGYKNDLISHPVATAILRFIANGSYSGRDIRNNFSKSPFGWPQDAIDTILIALVNAEYISSSEDQLPQGKIGVATFKKEAHTLTTGDKVKLRKMYSDCDIKCAPGDEFKSSGILLQELMRLTQKVSGDAPLPEPINTNFISQIEFQDGNARLQHMVASIQDISEKYSDWKIKSELVDKRFPLWELLEQLLDYGSGNEIASIITEANAIEQDRLFFANPDPISPLLQQTTSILKSNLNAAITEYNQIYDNRMAEMQANEYFVILPPEEKHRILLNNQILKKPETRDHDADSLRNSLSKTSLDAWKTKISALGSQFDNAIAEAVKLLEPKAESYSLPRKTLSSSAEIESYIKELQQQLEELLKSAKSIILK